MSATRLETLSVKLLAPSERMAIDWVIKPITTFTIPSATLAIMPTFVALLIPTRHLA